jgi:hypothetical protein
MRWPTHGGRFGRDSGRPLHAHRRRNGGKDFLISLGSKEIENQFAVRRGGQQPLAHPRGVPSIDPTKESKNPSQMFRVAVAERAATGPEVNGSTVNAKKTGEVLPGKTADPTKFANQLCR